MPTEIAIQQRSKGWSYAAVAWVGVIFLSSTSWALHRSEEAFSFLSELLISPSVREHPSFDLVHLLADKSLHVTLFLVLAVLLWKALPPGPSKPKQILVLGFLVGCCSEFLQRFFPDRDPALHDVLINLFGTALGVAVSFLIADRFGTPASNP